MKTIEISVKKREDLGKKATKNLRKEENVPCVMYGGTETLHFYAHENDFRNLVYTPNAYIVELNIDGKKHLATMKDLQFHPVTDKIQHIDFVEVIEGKAVTIDVPVELTGTSEGVMQGGKARLNKRTLKVVGNLANLPDKLTVNISAVKIGDTIKVADLSYDNIELLDPASSLVFAVVSSRLASKGMDITEETEGEEGEEGGETAEESAE